MLLSTPTSPTRPSPTLMGLRRLCCLRGVTPTAVYLPQLPSNSLGKSLYPLGGLASPRPSHPSQDGSPASEIRCQTAPLSSDRSLPKAPRPHPWEKGSITLFPRRDIHLCPYVIHSYHSLITHVILFMLYVYICGESSVVCSPVLYT